MARFTGVGNKMTIFDGASAKSINPWDMDSDRGWTNISGGDDLKTDEATYFRSVPWLYRAVKDRANCVSHMPYKIMVGGEEYDLEKDAAKPQPDLDWMESITTIFHKIEMSLALSGKAYCKLGLNSSKYIKYIRYLVPTSIREIYYTENDVDEDHAVGEVKHYEHTVGNKKIIYKPTEIVALYDPDWTTESGPGSSSAAKAALTSAEVLYHTDLFISKYFQHGAIKVTIFTTLGFQQDEAERLKRWWDKLVGIGRAWTGLVLKGETVKPVVIGEGLESLQNETLTTERRQNISTALGVPETRMWSSTSRLATSDMDTKNYYLSTIIPDNELIEEGFNEQVFTAEHQLDGYSLAFQPETLDIFQTEAADQAAALQALVNAKIPLLMAADLVGLDLTAEQRKELEDLEKVPEPVPPQLVDVTAGAQAQLPANVPAQQQDTTQQAGNPDQANALAMWQRKAIKRWKECGSAVCEFVSDDIPDVASSIIALALMNCDSIDSIKSVFAGVGNDVQSSEPINVTDQLRRALDWLEAHA
jgi:hypothetical protein